MASRRYRSSRQEVCIRRLDCPVSRTQMPSPCAMRWSACSRAAAVSDNGCVPDLKLNRVSWLFAVAKQVGQLFFPLVALVFFGIRDEWALWAGLGVVPLL